jgi:hypothetical protein
MLDVGDLARLVGTDHQGRALRDQRGRSKYDDEVGGPAYVAGRDGIDLDPLSAEQDASAKDAAQHLFEQIQRAASALRKAQ